MGAIARKYAVLVAAGVIAIGLASIAYSVVLNVTLAKNVNEAIKLASAATGFGVSVYAGTKALVELTKDPTAINAATVQAAGFTGVAGALLLLASQL